MIVHHAFVPGRCARVLLAAGADVDERWESVQRHVAQRERANTTTRMHTHSTFHILTFSHSTPNTQHPTTNTQHPTPNTQHLTPNTQHLTPNTQHPPSLPRRVPAEGFTIRCQRTTSVTPLHLACTLLDKCVANNARDIRNRDLLGPREQELDAVFVTQVSKYLQVDRETQ